VPDRFRNTPLHMASWLANPRIATALLTYEADP